MKIAIIGVGNVGGALATKWAAAGHQIFLGTRHFPNLKREDLRQNPRTTVHPIAEAVSLAEVILLATPAMATIPLLQQMGDTSGKVIIDAMNIIRGRGPEGFTNTAEAILAHTQTEEVVKCFNTTGYNNMVNPQYEGGAIDMFVCGDSLRGKAMARELALDAGFAECYDVGGNAQFDLMEQFALFWINLAVFQGVGRGVGFKLFRRGKD
ncbi:MAG: NAD(P)-binding domain-containing protein [Bacteroidota bacterium]